MQYFKKLAIVVLAIMMTQCTTESDEVVTNVTEENSVSEAVADKITKAGFDPAGARWSLDKQYVVVEGDIKLHIDQLNALSSIQKHRLHTSLVNCANVKEINLRLQGIKNQKIKGAIRLAMSHWNSVNKSLVKFIIDPNKAVDVSVTINNSLPSSVFADATLPNAGIPGRTLSINRKANMNFAPDSGAPRGANLTKEEWASIIAHELGHIIGFRHTGTQEGVSISPSNPKDKKSIMLPNVEDLVKLKGLSKDDKKVVKAIYGTKSNLCS